jgi:choloylglycine hydrolase
MMAAISPVRGSVKTAEGKDHYTVYTSCMDASAGVYYYTTYENSRICAVDLHKENLDGGDLIRYPMMHQADVFHQN